MFETVHDYATAGQNPLAFDRYYNSMAIPDTYAVAMGSNWRHMYDRYLHIVNPAAIYGVTAERSDGQYISFSSNSGTYTSGTDLDYSLTKSGTTWTLTDPDDSIETYSQSGAEATLQTIKRRGGYTLTMHYTSGRLTSVTDSYGRTLGMTYTGNLLTGLTTPDTLALTYGYVAFSSSNRLTTVSYNTSPATKQTYLYENASYPAALTGITDENNKRYATWTYDGKGRGVTSQLAGGINFISVSYYDNGDRKVAGPLGIVETYKFSPLQGAPKVTEIDRAANGTVAAATEAFGYDSNGYTQSVTDWNGNNTWYVNNSHGLPTSIYFASGTSDAHTTTISYDTTWVRLAHVITEPGLTTTLSYSSTGMLSTRVLLDTTSTSTPYSTNGQSRTWTYTWTPTGQLKTVQLPRTDVTAKTTFGYGAASPNQGTLVSITDALSHVTTVNTYKPGGLPLTVTDPNSVLTTLGYSTRLWLTSSALSVTGGTLTTSLQYDSAGNLTKSTLPDGSYLSYGYNYAYQPTSITNRLNESQALSFNSAGNLTQTLWKNASAVTKRQHTASFDALGRMRTDVGGMSQTTTFGYDSNGNVTGITDPLSHVTTQTFDHLNRLKTSKNPVLDLAQFTYDAHDRPLTVIDGKGNTTAYVYDGFGEVIQQTSPDTGVTVWTYDKDGNVASKTDASATYPTHSVNYTYDALDRLLTRAYPADSTLNVSLTYDQTGHGSGVGRLTTVTDQLGTSSLSLTYDQRGNVTSNARTIGTTTYTTGYSFESAGRLASVTYPVGGWKVSYARDVAGQVTSVTDKPPSASAVNLATSITHMPFGSWASLIYNNGATDTRTYDLDYRMTSVRDAGSATIQYLSYGYDADNNIHTITDNVTSGNSSTMTYDQVDRLKTMTGGTGNVTGITYDSNSNMLTYSPFTTYTVPATSDRFSKTGTSTTITYTSTGNVKSSGSASFTYNAANQMSSQGTGWAYSYDYQGLRLKQVAPSGTYIQAFDPAANLLSTFKGTAEYDYAYLDGVPVAAIAPSTSTVNTIHTDHLGSPQKVTNASQTVGWALLYSPYGNGAPSPATIQQDLRFPGQNFAAGGFYYNINRDFQVSWGRYVQADPLGLNGGLNPYIYARANPYKFTDKLGLQEDEDDDSDPSRRDTSLVFDPNEEIRETQDAIDKAEAESNLPNRPTASYLTPEAQRFLDLLNATKQDDPVGKQCVVSNLAKEIILDLLMPRNENGDREPVGEPGNRESVRVMHGVDAREFFDFVSSGGQDTTRPTYSGEIQRSLPNGGTIGYRPNSNSGEPTVDIDFPGVTYNKIKFLP